MPDRPTIPLTPIPALLWDQHYRHVATLAYRSEFVSRLLASDVPRRFRLGLCRMWIYRDPDGQVVGFGTLDICSDYAAFNAGRPHAYIPLLAVAEVNEGRGHGRSIVRHLSDEATLLAAEGQCVGGLYLDVYTSSEAAIHLYRKSGFAEISPMPLPDPEEAGQTYIVMAKRAEFIGDMSLNTKPPSFSSQGTYSDPPGSPGATARRSTPG